MTTTLYATRDFTDAGTGRSFAFGDELKDLKDGELLNYQHAGLASEGQPSKAAKAASAAAANKTEGAPAA